MDFAEGLTYAKAGFDLLRSAMRLANDVQGVLPPCEKKGRGELRELGSANFLYLDGELLIAHGYRRTQSDGEIAPPGLTLTRFCIVDPGALSTAGVVLTGSQLVTLFASVPLTK